MRGALVIVGLLALVDGCGNERNPFLVEAPRESNIPDSVVSACELARIRCSRCHAPGRILNAGYASADEWQRTIRRMRLMPGSSIRSDEEPVIAHCFVYRLDAARRAP